MLTKIKELLRCTISTDNFNEAQSLLNMYFKTGKEYDQELFYYAAIVAEKAGWYGLTILFLRQALTYGDNKDISDYLDAMTPYAEEPYEIDAITLIQKHFRIITYIGDLNTLNVFTREFIGIFRLLGYDVFAYEPNAGNNYIKMMDFIKDGPIDFVFMFNNQAFSLCDPNGEPLLNRLGCKDINFLVDHPAFTIKGKERMLISKNKYELLVDRNHIKFFANRKNLICTPMFMPHGGQALEIPIRPIANRSIDVLYVGSAKIGELPTDEMYKNIVSMMIENPNMDSRDVFELYFRECHGTSFAVLEENPQSSSEVLYKFEWTVLGVYRTAMVRILVENGIKVDVYGPGWDKTDFSDNPNLIKHEWTTAEHCLELMYDSKVVLNSMPWFKDGTHERIFNAMLAGSICVTDKSKWIDENLKNGENIVSFDLYHMEDMVEQVKNILADSDRYQHIADNGYKEAVAKHTWSHRAIEMINMIFN